MSRIQRAGLRQGIIQTSLEIGSELGEEGLTMRGIAARLGVSATALYQHFESKASILREIRIYGAELLQAEVIDKAASHGEPAERLAAAAHLYVQFARTHKWLYSVMMEHAQLDWAAMAPEELELMLRPLRVFQDWLREGAERGSWRRGVHVESAAFRLWLSMHGLCSMLNSGRIDEKHPAFPFADQETFIGHFIADTVDTLRAETAA
ncbi:MAG: TetR/AcrR family transcriptional regulator [Myxococcales bacterium]|jgi:AcrR family transcriptional regulator|nr:TetR/AcrR family transcriptional regulator [Myxococcales bacterium]